MCSRGGEEREVGGREGTGGRLIKPVSGVQYG